MEEEKAVCPYDPTHTFAKHKYIYHIHRCKIGKKFGHLYRTCIFNPLHIVLQQNIDQHQNQCESRVGIQVLISDIHDIINNPNHRNQDENMNPNVKEEEMEEEIKDELKMEEQEEQERRMVIYGAREEMEIEGWN